MMKLLCLGAGGHAAVVIDSVNAMSISAHVRVVGLVTKAGGASSVLGIPVLGDDDDIPRLVSQTGAEGFVIGLGMVRGGDPLRARLFSLALASGLRPFTILHPSAVVSPHARIAAGATIMAGAVIQPRASIGENAIINTRASIDHDCVIGAHAHVAPGVTLSGDVRVGHTAHLGTGAVVRNGIVIGDNATVGAGAVLISDCPAGATMTGVPAGIAGKAAT